MSVATRHRQTGITALGFLILATLFGVVGLGAIKVVPMYIKNMRMNTILDEIQKELNGQGANPATIRVALAKRFAVEDINMDVDKIQIAQSKDGYALRVAYENRAPYVADIYLVVAYNKQVEIRR
ncbi:MAG TPA: DUF4845 domain-containing protein [Gammaproteobacteria bacterium]|nr:DUF4845 domain-containing protein [Gammaproteobacteria bacterium]